MKCDVFNKIQKLNARVPSGKHPTNQIPKKWRLEKSKVIPRALSTNNSFQRINPWMQCPILAFWSVWFIVFLQSVARKETSHRSVLMTDFWLKIVFYRSNFFWKRCICKCHSKVLYTHSIYFSRAKKPILNKIN